ncbi:DUF432 domain-containing protein [Alteromonas gilva]|uniref:DUF432 domain-containing protein n=1 Tax=Alteromonas gilva TaxID=2987522 RepID=A0ABT5L5M4_9ALTE|nr:DUF432 domain-containing protein [Alteromonas gilva]MDC8831068.1 DUF432 domain-containing protein [Alteromonas gilva]
MTKSNEWWGQFTFSPDEIKCWRIGERCIAIKRGLHEWTVWNKQTYPEQSEVVICNCVQPDENFDDVDYQRFMVKQTGDTLIIEPSLADRAMIVRPSKPIIVMPDEEVRLYVSTPMWMTVLLPNREEPMTDIPFWRPSDSWFGSSTMRGDICYAKYTEAKMDRSRLENRSHRAFTTVTIKNDQEDPLSIQRLNLPVPALKLYIDQDQQFWTEQVNIVQRTEHSSPVSHVKQSLPEDPQSMVLVSESREMSKKPSFLSTIKSLVG